jgi:UDP-N-acetylmuramate: L-alanyl-gamma-D-glutamyl-meso-diaminopimelate ligase
VDSLSLADQVVLAGVFHSEKIPEAERLHPENVVSALLKSGRDALLLENANAIVTNLVSRLESGDVVAILSNGGFDGIYEKLPAALERRASQA